MIDNLEILNLLRYLQTNSATHLLGSVPVAKCPQKAVPQIYTVKYIIISYDSYHLTKPGLASPSSLPNLAKKKLLKNFPSNSFTSRIPPPPKTTHSPKLCGESVSVLPELLEETSQFWSWDPTTLILMPRTERSHVFWKPAFWYWRYEGGLRKFRNLIISTVTLTTS